MQRGRRRQGRQRVVRICRPHRSRRHVPVSAVFEMVLRLRRTEGRQDQLPVDRLGRGHQAAQRRHRRFRRIGQPDERRRHREGQRPGNALSDRPRRCCGCIQSPRPQCAPEAVGRRSCRHLRRAHHEVERSAHHFAQRRRDATRRRHSRGASLRRQRDDLRFHRLSCGRQPVLGIGPRPRQGSLMARRARR